MRARALEDIAAAKGAFEGLISNNRISTFVVSRDPTLFYFYAHGYALAVYFYCYCFFGYLHVVSGPFAKIIEDVAAAHKIQVVQLYPLISVRGSKDAAEKAINELKVSIEKTSANIF